MQQPSSLSVPSIPKTFLVKKKQTSSLTEPLLYNQARAAQHSAYNIIKNSHRVYLIFTSVAFHDVFENDFRMSHGGAELKLVPETCAKNQKKSQNRV